MTQTRYLQTKEIAAKLGCRTDSVRRMFREGRLPGAFKLGGVRGRIRISESDLKRLVKSRKGGR